MTEYDEGNIFAERMNNIPRSFIREILKTALEPGMISFAGGLPNKDLFPAEALKAACAKVFDLHGPGVLQYSNSEGLFDLRVQIAKNYERRGIRHVKPENILITSGSQQALDLLAKILVNKGDRVIVEEPSYLGAIQALALFRPQFVTVPLSGDGMDVDALKRALAPGAKMMYVIPNFQNPSGISYSEENRRAVADVVRGTPVYLVDDDPYGELRFSGGEKPSFMTLAPENTILLGSFSKTVVPAFRLGWVVVPAILMEKLVVAKQAADLHTNSFVQHVIHHYLLDNDTSVHIARIVARYSTQKKAMLRAASSYFPDAVETTDPDGGMFLWATLPHNISSMTLFEHAVKDRVCIVPGHPFYLGKDDVSTMRLSFSCVDEATIDEGMRRIGSAAHKLCAGHIPVPRRARG